MSKQKFRITEHFFFMILFAVMMAALASLSVTAAEKVSITEGTYYIKAINGNAKGQVLYWDEKASDPPYLTSTKGPHVFCGPFSNQDDAFEFMRESGTNNYSNLSIWSREDKYRFNRHKAVKPFKADLIYVNANKDNDTNNKLWELVPVNYVRNMSKAAPSVTAKKNGKVAIDWKKFFKKIKKSEVFKKAKYIQIQYSTDKSFMKKSVTKTKKIKKKAINKAKAKSILSKLRKKKKYYFRVRLIDAKGVRSNWSKTIKVKTKK